VPPLRDHRVDPPELVEYLIARFYREDPAATHRITRVTATCLASLARYPWPGNVRELRNVIFQSLVKELAGDELLLSDPPERIVRGAPEHVSALFDRTVLGQMIDGGRMNLCAVRDELERAALELALATSGGSPARAARPAIQAAPCARWSAATSSARS